MINFILEKSRAKMIEGDAINRLVSRFEDPEDGVRRSAAQAFSVLAKFGE